jgi:23S rRNA (uridine2552-2'-O)-methyltransferase
MRQRKDHFYRRAKAEGHAGRAVYKLEEIDRRFRLFKPGCRVLDLGCWPGSWLAYAAGRAGPGGLVVGVDRAALDRHPPAGAQALVADVFELDPARLLALAPAYDVVLSDMAPDTAGDRVIDCARSAALVGRALEIALGVLRPGGAFVAKIFQGPDVDALVAEVRSHFAELRRVKPEASRRESMEIYLVATGCAGGRS